MVLDISKYALQQQVFYILCEVSTRECSEKIKKKVSHRNTIYNYFRGKTNWHVMTGN
jgi:hypothetical protein